MDEVLARATDILGEASHAWFNSHCAEVGAIPRTICDSEEGKRALLVHLHQLEILYAEH